MMKLDQLMFNGVMCSAFATYQCLMMGMGTEHPAIFIVAAVGAGFYGWVGYNFWRVWRATAAGMKGEGE